MKQRATLETQRLILRPFELTDARAVQRLAGEYAIADTTLNIPHPYEDGMAEQWIATHQPKFEAGELANFAITQRETGELLGAIGLVINRRFDRAELGYWIGVPYWGCGYCTEAGHAVLRYGFTDLNLNRIHAYHLSRNPASGRVMEKLGMTREGLLRQHVKKWGKYEDLVEYGLVRQDWMKFSEQRIFSTTQGLGCKSQEVSYVQPKEIHHQPFDVAARNRDRTDVATDHADPERVTRAAVNPGGTAG